MRPRSRALGQIHGLSRKRTLPWVTSGMSNAAVASAVAAPAIM